MSQSEKQIAGNQRRTLRAMSLRLLVMADAWDGVDEFNLGELIGLADRVEQVAAGLVEDDVPLPYNDDGFSGAYR